MLIIFEAMPAKKLLLILFTLAFCFSLRAGVRDSIVSGDHNFIEDQAAMNEVGFDLNFFLNIFRSQYEPTTSTLFSLSYNRELSNHYVLRSVFGMGYADLQSQSLNLSPLTTRNNQQDIKIGLARKVQCYKRWLFYFGMDWEFQHGYALEQLYTTVANDQCIVNNTTKTILTGPGPFSGIEFFINPRISLNIESNLNFVYKKDIESSTNALHPETNTQLTTKGYSSEFTIPQSLFINIKF